MCDERTRKRQLEHRRHTQPLSRDEIEQFYAGLAQAELNQDPRSMKLQWWSEVTPGQLRFQCSFKRPSIEAVDEVVKRLSGDSRGPSDSESAEFSHPSTASLELTVHRISIDMEDQFGRQPSMEELAAGVAIAWSNDGRCDAWCEERLTNMVKTNLGMLEIPWDRSVKRLQNRTIIPASMDMDDDAEGDESPRRRSLGKDTNESDDLAWLRQSSTAAIETLRGSQSWRASSTDGSGAAWRKGQNHAKRTTIMAQLHHSG